MSWTITHTVTAPLSGDSILTSGLTILQSINPTIIGGSGGTTDHSALTNLAYSVSGHTGFEPAKGTDDNYVTDAEKIKLSNLSGTNTGDQTIPTKTSDLTNDSGFITSVPVTSVNSETGAVVLTTDDISEGSINLYSTNTRIDARITAATGVSVQGYSSVLANTTASFTTSDETKLDGIEAGAQVNDVTSVAGRTGAVTLSASDVSGLATVATSGSYSDLSNQPTIPDSIAPYAFTASTSIDLSKPNGTSSMILTEASVFSPITGTAINGYSHTMKVNLAGFTPTFTTFQNFGDSLPDTVSGQINIIVFFKTGDQYYYNYFSSYTGTL